MAPLANSRPLAHLENGFMSSHEIVNQFTLCSLGVHHVTKSHCRAEILQVAVPQPQKCPVSLLIGQHSSVTIVDQIKQGCVSIFQQISTVSAYKYIYRALLTGDGLG